MSLKGKRDKKGLRTRAGHSGIEAKDEAGNADDVNMEGKVSEEPQEDASQVKVHDRDKDDAASKEPHSVVSSNVEVQEEAARVSEEVQSKKKQ